MSAQTITSETTSTTTTTHITKVSGAFTQDFSQVGLHRQIGIGQSALDLSQLLYYGTFVLTG